MAMRPSFVKTTDSLSFSQTPTYGASTSGGCGSNLSSTEPGTSPPSGVSMPEPALEQEEKKSTNALTVHSVKRI